MLCCYSHQFIIQLNTFFALFPYYECITIFIKDLGITLLAKINPKHFPWLCVKHYLNNIYYYLNI